MDDKIISAVSAWLRFAEKNAFEIIIQKDGPEVSSIYV